MKDKTKKFIKKYWVLFLTFFIINIFIMIISLNIFSLEAQLKVTNSLFTENAKMIVFNNIKDRDFEDLLEVTKGEQIVVEATLFQNNEKIKNPVSGLYYNYPLEKTYPIVEGRMFTIDEIKNKEKVSLVGYDLISEISDKNEIILDDEKYKVVGVIGAKNSSTLNDKIYINLSSVDFSLNNELITVDAKSSDTIEITDKIYFALSKDQEYPSISIEEPNSITDPLDAAMGDNRIYIYITIFLIICLVATIINISYFWVENEKRIIGIKRLIGGTNKKLSISFYFEYQIVILLTLILAVIVFSILNKMNLFQLFDFNYNILFKSIVIMELINITISTIAIIPSLIKLNSMDINTIIKETN